MKKYTKEQYTEDLSLLNVFTEHFVEQIQDRFISVQLYEHERDADPVIYPSQMLVLGLRTGEYRNAKKYRIRPISANIFIDTDINPNGIDSSGRIGRTWAINFTINCNVRRYRCKNEEPYGYIHFYTYAESEQEVIDKFTAWYDKCAEARQITGLNNYNN